MNSGKIVAGRVDGTGGESKVLQEVLADLKIGGVGTAKRKEIDPVQLHDYLYLPTTTNQATFFHGP